MNYGMSNDNIIGIRIIEDVLYIINYIISHDTAYGTCGEITLYANYLAEIYSYIVSKSLVQKVKKQMKKHHVI